MRLQLPVSTQTQHKAVVLLSGGLDSATAMAEARARGWPCAALTVDYGQRHRGEIDAARRIAARLGAVEHRIVSIDLRAIGGSALTDEIPVPEATPHSSNGGGGREADAAIPVTYVPARNAIMLSIAAGYAEVCKASIIVVGVNAVDYSGYPDCRPEFIEAMERALNLGTRAGVEGARHGRTALRIHAPLVNLSKAEIIRLGMRLGVDYSMTQSCYDPAGEGIACGVCEACALRRRGFAEASVPDPTRYAERVS